MGIHQDLVDFDEAFKVISADATIINDLPSFTTRHTDLIHNQIYTCHSPDSLSNVPRCDCGASTKEYRLHTVCPQCNTKVRHVLADKLETVTWIRAPLGVSGLINPTMWTMLSKRFSIGKFNLIQYLTDAYYQPTEHERIKAKQIIDVFNFERSLNYFIKNFEKIKNILFELKVFRLPKSKTKHSRDFLRELLDKSPNCIFSYHLPIPHRSLLVVEDGTSGGVYLDEYTPRAIDAVLTLAGIDTPSATGEVSTNVRMRESRAVRAVMGLSEYYYHMVSKRLAKKEGIFRKHIYASRSHFSFRAVISSITKPHDHRQIEIPWGVAVSVFQLHLYNKLFKLGFTPNEIQSFLEAHISVHHPLLEHLFKELITEAPSKLGICATLNRPPSLKRGSIQKTYIGRVKTPEEGLTVSMSILIVRPLNADFDGDALQFTLALDGLIENALEALAPRMNMFSLGKVRGVDSALEHPKNVVATIASWMHYEGDEIDPIIHSRMMALPDAPPPRAAVMA